MKSLSYFVVGLLLFSSLAAIGIGKNASVDRVDQKNLTNIEKKFLEPNFIEKEVNNEKFVEISIENTNTVSYKVGKPLLPIYKKTIELPFGTTISNIDVKKGIIETETINGKILPVPKPALQGIKNSKIEYIPSEAIYNKNSYYPEKNYEYTITAGLDENSNHKNFLTISIYPARYNPVENTVEYSNDIELQIDYNQPETKPFKTTANYDMVIIAPNAFSSRLNKFVRHKDSYGVSTTIKTTEEIYSEYEGIDKPEQIKYFIKDAIETWNIKYVLLVGGMTSTINGISRDDKNKGVTDWYVPVRYTNLREQGSVYDPGFLSDLYYADIYNSQGEFSSWDKDKQGESDGIFAAWGVFFTPKKDILDLNPDVYVGRLPCRSTNEVDTVVDKIIDYEKYKHKTDWYNDMIMIAGDSHDDPGTNYIEGEVSCDYVYDSYMSEYNPVKIYSSKKETDPTMTPTAENIIREISKGSGHLLFEGHGHPGGWNTHWPGIYDWENSPGGVDIYDFPKFSNDGIKQPVCVVGGCHNGQFNVTLMATTRDDPFMWTHGLPVPESFCWHLVRKSKGGAIASFGNTGLGYGAVGDNGDIDGDGENLPDTLEAFGGYQIKLFYEIFDEGEDIIGKCWGETIKRYLNTFPGMSDKTHCKTVEQWPLFGDPSLKIGGYRTDEQSKSKDIDFNYRFPVINNILDRLLELPLFQYLIEKTKINFKI